MHILGKNKQRKKGESVLKVGGNGLRRSCGASCFMKEILVKPKVERLELLGLGKCCPVLEVTRLSF